MPFITKVVATRIYRNYQYEVPEDFITKHFGSQEAVIAAFSGDDGELSHDAAGDEFFEELEDLDYDIVEQESNYDEQSEYFCGKVTKHDRWVEGDSEDLE